MRVEAKRLIWNLCATCELRDWSSETITLGAFRDSSSETWMTRYRVERTAMPRLKKRPIEVENF